MKGEMEMEMVRKLPQRPQRKAMAGAARRENGVNSVL